MSNSTQSVFKNFSNLFESTRKQISYFLKGNSFAVESEEDGENSDNFNPSLEFARYERSVANKLGYFALSRTRFTLDPFGKYGLESTSPIAQMIYFFFYFNTLIKSIFLLFLILDYFGPVVFLDKIAALDYILCVGIVACGHLVWVNRYPIHEIMHGFWTIENRIFKALGCPKDVKRKAEKRHFATVWIHFIIVWVGCGCLVIQVFADPKYCAFTYSAFEYDSRFLRVVFSAHEFFFMMHPWTNNTVTTSLCTIEAISIANLVEMMTEKLKEFYQYNSDVSTRAINFSKENKLSLSKAIGDKRKVKVQNTSRMSFSAGRSTYDSIDKLIFDYKQLMLITDVFNQFVANKLYLLHLCSYCQFISDVFVAIQVLKLDGTGFMDVWFYLEDCLAGVYMIYRVYSFMSRVSTQSKKFLRAFHEYRTYGCSRKKLRIYKKTSRTLKLIGLRLGPFMVTPMTVLSALQTFGNYYVCVALW